VIKRIMIGRQGRDQRDSPFLITILPIVIAGHQKIIPIVVPAPRCRGQLQSPANKLTHPTILKHAEDLGCHPWFSLPELASSQNFPRTSEILDEVVEALSSVGRLLLEVELADVDSVSCSGGSSGTAIGVGE